MALMSGGQEQHKPVQHQRRAAMGKGILDVAGAARLLGVSPGTIYKLARAGDIPGRRVGREWRFSHAMLTKWIEESPAPNADQLAALLRSARVSRKI
jgi:excisionase family DNA binding protein